MSKAQPQRESPAEILRSVATKDLKVLLPFPSVQHQTGVDEEQTMFVSKALLIVPIFATLFLLAGCGGIGSNCQATGLNVTPATASASHTAAPPTNSQTFNASSMFSGSGCIGLGTAALVSSNWTTSDPSVHLSASPATMVTATCTAAVAGPVTITATSASGSMLTGKASLTCN